MVPRTRIKIDVESIQDAVVDKLHDWLNSLPAVEKTKPIIGVAGSDDALSPQDIVQEVEEGTPEGQRLVQRWVEETVKHIMDTNLQSDSEELLELDG